jgi:hypothetical protein
MYSDILQVEVCIHFLGPSVCKVKNIVLPKDGLHFCNKFLEREGSTQLFLLSGMILS